MRKRTFSALMNIVKWVLLLRGHLYIYNWYNERIINFKSIHEQMDNKEIQASYQKNFKSSISIEYIYSQKVDYIYFSVYVSKCKLHLWHTNSPVDNVVFGFLERSSFFYSVFWGVQTSTCWELYLRGDLKYFLAKWRVINRC